MGETLLVGTLHIRCVALFGTICGVIYSKVSVILYYLWSRAHGMCHPLPPPWGWVCVSHPVGIDLLCFVLLWFALLWLFAICFAVVRVGCFALLALLYGVALCFVVLCCALLYFVLLCFVLL